jgi:LEA14-like dessication related protein
MQSARSLPRLAAAAILMSVSASLFAFDIPKPSAEVRSFRLEAISLRDVTFAFDVAVKNPYPVKLSFDGMTLDFTVEGAKVFTAASQGGFSVDAKGERTNSFTVALPYDGIIRLVKDYAQKDWLNTVIDGKIVIPIPRVPMMPNLPKDVSFSYRFEKKIPAIKPEVAILDFTVRPPTEDQIAKAAIAAGKKVDPGKALGVFKSVLAGKKPTEPVIDPTDLDVPLTISYTIAVTNEAKGPLSFDKLGYQLLVNDEMLVDGESSKVVRDGARTLITVENTFSSKRLSQGIKAIFSDKKGRFNVKGSASIKFPDEIRKEPVPLAVDESGEFKL